MNNDCVFCYGHADTTINHGKTDCCSKCKEEVRKENEKASEVTFETMMKLVDDMKKDPIATQIRVDPRAFQILKAFGQEILERNNQVLQPPPNRDVNVYNVGLPVYVDKMLKVGQWQAVDRNGKVLEEGNLLPKYLTV